jgi:hypothetical protein
MEFYTEMGFDWNIGWESHTKEGRIGAEHEKF